MWGMGGGSSSSPQKTSNANFLAPNLHAGGLEQRLQQRQRNRKGSTADFERPGEAERARAAISKAPKPKRARAALGSDVPALATIGNIEHHWHLCGSDTGSSSYFALSSSRFERCGSDRAGALNSR